MTNVMFKSFAFMFLSLAALALRGFQAAAAQGAISDAAPVCRDGVCDGSIMQGDQDGLAASLAAPEGGLQLGHVAVMFTDNSGAPFEGLQVVLTELDRRGFTDSDGRVFFSDVPAGPVTIGLRKTFLIVEPDETTTEGEAFIDDLIRFFVPPFQVTTVEGTADVPDRIPRPPCPGVPWCFLAGAVVPAQGLWRVDGNTASFGCSVCSNVASPNIGAVACPGLALIAGAWPPAPGQVWSIVTSTCLPTDPNPLCSQGPVVSTAPRCSILF